MMVRFILERLRALFIGLRRSIVFRWRSLRQCVLWAGSLISRFWRPVPIHPLTAEQRDEQRRNFIRSINKNAVGALASRYNNQKDCLVSDDIRHGSYNVCFFVAFPDDGKHWVVRIPINPLVSNVWDKLQSEVATMRFIQRHTTIPIPAIHAYGRGEHLTDDASKTQSFLILDQLAGQPLQLRKLYSSPIHLRHHFFSEFGHILAQLQKLQFNKTGSLYPDPEDDATFIIGPSLCLAENDIAVNTRKPRKTWPAFTSTTAAIRHQYGMVVDAFEVPTADASQDTIKREIFALHSVGDQLPKYDNSSWSDQSFMLSHGDLRCDNILVDDDFRIQGIIDWEWAIILPHQLCTPPLWICGHDPGMVDIPSAKIFEDFQSVITTNSPYHEYLDYWKQEPLHLSMAQILRHPHHLILIFYKHIYPRMYKERFSNISPTFFASQDKQKSLERRLDASKHYTDYLKEHGLFVVDELTQRMRDLLEKSAELQAELQKALAAEGIR